MAYQRWMGIGPSGRPPASDVLNIITKLKDRGFTIVLVEQNFRFAAPLADRHYVMEHGKIAETFAASELASKTQMLHEYLGV